MPKEEGRREVTGSHLPGFRFSILEPRAPGYCCSSREPHTYIRPWNLANSHCLAANFSLSAVRMYTYTPAQYNTVCLPRAPILRVAHTMACMPRFILVDVCAYCFPLQPAPPALSFFFSTRAATVLFISVFQYTRLGIAMIPVVKDLLLSSFLGRKLWRLSIFVKTTLIVSSFFLFSFLFLFSFSMKTF